MPTLGITASSISGSLSSAPTNSYFPIASYTVPSGGLATITFGNIPQTFQHLQIRWSAKSTTTTEAYSNVQMYYNGDVSNSNGYRSHYLYGQGATVYSTTSTYPIIGMVPDDYGSQGSMYGAAVIDILDYTNPNKNKTAKCLYGEDVNGVGGVVGFNSTLYISTTAITSISLSVLNGTSPKWKEYSNISIYGVN